MATRVDSRVAAVLGAVAVLVLGACTGTLGDYVGNNAGSASGGTPNDAGIPDASGGLPGVDSGNPPSGQEMFVAVCAPCHGSEGQGSPLGPELQHPVADFATWVVRSGRATTSYPAAMASFAPAAVSDAQLDEIWAWLDGLPKPTDGQELYEDYCANCHGSDALGGRVGKNIDGKELADLQEKVREGEGGNDYGNTVAYMPHWSATQLSNEELELIGSYIAGL